jgi:hypothetical protein
MTSSETPTETEAAEPPPPKPEASEPAPAQVAVARPVARPFPMWLGAVVLVPPGWAYVLHNVRWHLTASTVMLLICWAAVVATGFWAVRMAMAAATEGDEGWFAVRGKREELEREKRGLLKAIKDIEFDHETGKLSKDDAAALTASYRARAIEVIKTIEAEAGETTSAATVREQILAEVRARAALDQKTKGKKPKKSKEQAS